MPSIAYLKAGGETAPCTKPAFHCDALHFCEMSRKLRLRNERAKRVAHRSDAVGRSLSLAHSCGAYSTSAPSSSSHSRLRSTLAAGILKSRGVRFEERLTTTIDYAPDLGRTKVSSLILQPLVENAIKHGVAQRASGGHVGISAAISDSRLMIIVNNDGPPLCDDWQSASGRIGFVNVRER